MPDEARGHEEVAAPSGELAVRIGVWNSTKHCASMRRRMLGSRANAAGCLLHRLAPQVEEAVAQAGVLRIVALGVDLERQLLGGRLEEQASATTSTSPVGRFGLTVSGLRATTGRSRDHAFQAHPLRVPEEQLLGLKHDLGDAVMVAQIDEQQLPVIALAVHPAGQATVSPTWSVRNSPQLWVR